MRAFGFTRVGGPEQQAFLDVPEPVPGPDELAVRVRAVGVNPGDWRLRNGEYGVEPPAVLGREVAGTVVALGPGVGGSSAGLAVGDEVFGGCPGMVGGFAETALVTASFAARRPDDVAATDAAALPVAAGTAYDALTCLDLPPGATVLVNGAGGGVGIAMTQLARARGLRVVGTASAAKADVITACGGVPVTYGEGVLDRIAEAAPDGVQGLLDMAGGEALRTVAPLVDPGHLYSISDKPLVRELGGRDVTRDRSTAVLAELARLVATGELDPHVTAVFPFDETAAALAEVETGHTRGKVVVTLD